MLTEKEKEVLTWFARGKTAWETGQIMGVSQRTVEEYARSAKVKLNGSNTVHAVVNAYKANKIAPSIISSGLGLIAAMAEMAHLRFIKELTRWGLPYIS